MAKIDPVATSNLLPGEQDLKRSVFLARIAKTTSVEKDVHLAGGVDRLRFGLRRIAKKRHRLVGAFALVPFHIPPVGVSRANQVESPLSKKK